MLERSQAESDAVPEGDAAALPLELGVEFPGKSMCRAIDRISVSPITSSFLN